MPPDVNGVEQTLVAFMDRVTTKLAQNLRASPLVSMKLSEKHIVA